MMANVAFVQVSKHYASRNVQALRDLSLEIADGELMVLVGPSGSGKTTILRLLAGLEQPSGGEMRIQGRRINDLPPQRRNLAMVFQNYALYPHMSVRRNLEFPLQIKALPRHVGTSRIQKIAGLLGIQDMLSCMPGELSSGQMQRVAMGRALVRDPDVFLLDEPLSNLDPQMRTEIRNDIAELQRRLGTTTIYVTHDQTEALTLGDRIAVLSAGRLQQVATAGELYDRPVNTFVALFIGSPPMNIFKTCLNPDGDAAKVEFGEHRIRLAPSMLDGVDREQAVTCRTLLVGLRPDAFHPVAGGREDNHIEAEIRTVEHLGHEQLAFLYSPLPMIGLEAAGGVPDADGLLASGERRLFAVRLPAHPRVAAQQLLRLKVDTAHLHLFDEEGRALSRV